MFRSESVCKAHGLCSGRMRISSALDDSCVLGDVVVGGFEAPRLHPQRPDWPHGCPEGIMACSRLHHFGTIGAVAVGLLAAAGGCGGELDPTTGSVAQDVTGTLTLASTQNAVSLAASNGNLYWTSNFGGDGFVWRAAKTNVPGNEVQLYTEHIPGGNVSFGNIVFTVTGGFFAYFDVTEQTASGTTTTIKRVPLSGGAAEVVATVPSPPVKAMATDQTSAVFFIDQAGLRSLPLTGGGLTTLYQAPFLHQIALDPTHVYFAEQQVIRSVPKTGGAATAVVTPSEGTITALYVDASTATMYWAVLDVQSMVLGSGTVNTLFPRGTGRNVYSIGWDGSRVLWSECLSSNLTSCFVMAGSGFTETTIGGLGEDDIDMGDLQWDAASVFWPSAVGIQAVCPGSGVGSCGCSPEPLATTCAGKACGPATNNCGQPVTCPDTCVAPSTCGGAAGPNSCTCISSGNPCGNRCGGTATDNCGNVFTCHADCGIDGQCPVAGGTCVANFCSCRKGPPP